MKRATTGLTSSPAFIDGVRRAEVFPQPLIDAVALRLLIVWMMAVATGSATPDLPGEREADLTVMSYNILYDSPKWGVDYAWPRRQPLMAALLKRQSPDLVGFQEVRSNQLNALQNMLPDHAFIGNVPGADVSPDMPWLMNPVFFRLDRLQLIEAGFAWLTSQDGRGVPQLGWPEAGLTLARPSHAVWAKFLCRASGELFYHINVHLPPGSAPAREKATTALVALFSHFATGEPLLVTGDFNATDEPALDRLISAGLVDARAQAERLEGPMGTKVNRATGRVGSHPIDHLFVSPGVRILHFLTVADQFEQRFPSDHLPVLARMRFPKSDSARRLTQDQLHVR
jgi:endonuclease/exonuclease/phosphatase family metal-dependent hydrolase